ncbi:transporter substrate-binding domain-containing protein [Brackiella oedipodis]|uniref:transporter substrate-binding domain-containing protein n=1 Tax=Brackiella oedipodis TaxID=124225 RepID=UPI00048BA3EB|nr:transporter substrate-binding domain-containing protein [Brackiella oedipodis]
MIITPAIQQAIAPKGVLRASINLGNKLLAGRNDQGIYGISVDLANELAHQLELAIEFKVFDKAMQSVAAVSNNEADFGFFAIDPERGQSIAFTPAYVLIEGYYLVRDESPFQTNADIDQAGNRIVVGQGSAYDLFLSRHIKKAEIIRAASSQQVVQEFLTHDYEVAAGVKQQLQSDIADKSGLHLLDKRFMVIEQAMGCAKDRDPSVIKLLNEFVTEMLNNGFVADAAQRHNITGIQIANAQD